MAIGRFTRDLKGPAQTPELSFEEAMFVPMQRKAEKDKITDALFAIDTGVLATEQDKAGILNDITNDYNAQIENIANTISGNNANLYDARKQVLALNKDVAQAKNTGIYYQATKYYNEREEAKKNFFDPKNGQDMELLNSKWNEWELGAKEQGLDGAYNPNTGELITAHNFPRPPVSQDHTSHLLDLAGKAGVKLEEIEGSGLRVETGEVINNRGQRVPAPVIIYGKKGEKVSNEEGLKKFIEFIELEYGTKGNAFADDWEFKGNGIKEIINLAKGISGIVSSEKIKSNEEVSLSAANAVLKGTEKDNTGTSLLDQATQGGANIPVRISASALNATTGDPESVTRSIASTTALIPGLGNADDQTSYKVGNRVEGFSLGKDGWELTTEEISQFPKSGMYRKKKRTRKISDAEYKKIEKFATPELVIKQPELSFINKGINEKMFNNDVQEFITSRKNPTLRNQLQQAYDGQTGGNYTKEQVEGLALQNILKNPKKLSSYVDSYDREIGSAIAFNSVGYFPIGTTTEEKAEIAALKTVNEQRLYSKDLTTGETTLNKTTMLYPITNPTGNPTTPARLLGDKGAGTYQIQVVGSVNPGNPSQLSKGFLVEVYTEDGGVEHYALPEGGMQGRGTPAEELLHSISRGASIFANNTTTIPNIQNTSDDLVVETTRLSKYEWDVKWGIEGPNGNIKYRDNFKTNDPASILTEIDLRLDNIYIQTSNEENKKKTNVEAPLVENTSNDNDSRNINLTTIDREGTLTQEDLIAQLEPWEEEVRNRGGGVAVLTKSFGNLRPNSSNPYQDGIYQTNGAGAYQTFDSYDSGLKGLIWDVKAKQFKDGLTSRVINKNANVLEALKIWAPAEDKNNPNIYAKNVLDFINSSLGTNYTTNSLFSDLPTSELVEAIIKQEDIQLYSTLKSDGFFKDRINLYADNIKGGNIV